MNKEKIRKLKFKINKVKKMRQKLNKKRMKKIK